MSGAGWIGLGNFGFELDQWYCLAILRDGNNLSAYVNGIHIGSNTVAAAQPDPATTLQFGTAESGHPGRVFRGKIDDVRIYKRVLSEEEIMILCGLTPTNDLYFNAQNIEILPNPNSGVFTLQFKKEISHPLLVNILNVLGDKIYYQKLDKGITHTKFDLSNHN